MSKMIAVLDNINDCSDCPLCIKVDSTCWKCNMAKIYMGGLNLTKRPHFCPLVEFSEKRRELDLNKETDKHRIKQVCLGCNSYENGLCTRSRCIIDEGVDKILGITD